MVTGTRKRGRHVSSYLHNIIGEYWYLEVTTRCSGFFDLEQDIRQLYGDSAWGRLCLLRKSTWRQGVAQHWGKTLETQWCQCWQTGASFGHWHGNCCPRAYYIDCQSWHRDMSAIYFCFLMQHSPESLSETQLTSTVWDAEIAFQRKMLGTHSNTYAPFCFWK